MYMKNTKYSLCLYIISLYIFILYNIRIYNSYIYIYIYLYIYYTYLYISLYTVFYLGMIKNIPEARGGVGAYWNIFLIAL